MYSDLALFVIPAAILYELFYRDRKKAMLMISSYTFLFAVVVTLKFAFHVPRPTGIDPFSFPSGHSALASGLIYFYPNILTVLYAFTVGLLRVLEGVHTWADVFAGFLVGAVVPLLFVKLLAKIGKEADRQAVHMGFGIFLGYLLFLNRWAGVVSLLSFLIIGIFLYVLRKKLGIIREFLDRYDREGTGIGAFTLVLGLLITALLWSDAWKAAFFVALVDGAATLTGKLFGTKRKSYIGTLGGCAAGIIASLATGLPIWIGILVGIIEYLSPFDDNIVLPVSVYLLSVFA